jgi:hypothetical protein
MGRGGKGACTGATASGLWSGGRTPVLRTVKSWTSNQQVIARNSVARVRGAREMVRQKPLFQRLGPDVASITCQRASSETLVMESIHQRHVTRADPCALCDWHTRRPIALYRSCLGVLIGSISHARGNIVRLARICMLSSLLRSAMRA